MKKICLILVTAIALLGCKEDDGIQETSLYGTWKLYGSGDYNVNDTNDVTVNPWDMYLTFNEDGTVAYTYTVSCGTGDFMATENTIEMVFNCVKVSTGENITITSTYNYQFNGRYLELHPTSTTCESRCDLRYVRVE